MDFKRLGIKDVKYLAKGKRGIIYAGYYKGKRTAIKIKRKTSLSKNRILNELKFLKILNKYGIGPRLIKGNNKYLIYEFVEGDFILEFIKKSNKKKIVKILKEILRQCFILDKLKINKLEMHNPLKHVIINKKPVLIDFERCYYTKNTKNVSQFCQFLMSFSSLLEKKYIKINSKKLVSLLKEYKKNYSIKAFKRVLSLIS